MTDRKLPSGTQLELGPLARDLPFMVRNLQALLRPEGQAIRDELGIEGGGIGVLSIIWQNPDISQNDLADCLALKKSAITKVVKSLEDQGLVTRRRVSSDRRMNALKLTDHGQEKIAAFQKLSNALHARLFGEIADSDRDAFLKVLNRLFEDLSRERAAPIEPGLAGSSGS